MKKIFGFALVSLILLAGCKSSYITSSWKAKNAVAKKYNKVLVLGLIREEDRRLQEKMEDHMASELKDLGYQTTTSLQEYGSNAFYNLTEKEALSKLNKSEVDAVVTVVLLNKKMEREFVPSRSLFQDPGYYRNRFWNYYGTINSRIDEPGYYFTNTQYFWESNFYDLNNQALVYSVQTQSFNPDNAESLGHEYGSMIVKDMVRKNVVTNQGQAVIKGF